MGKPTRYTKPVRVMTGKISKKGGNTVGSGTHKLSIVLGLWAGVLVTAVLAEAPSTAPAGGGTTASVLDWGAQGDGRADDTDAIQRAVDAGIGTIYLPKGVYRITRPIVIDLDKVGYTSITGHGVARFVMAGPGPTLRIVGTHFGSAAPAGFAPEVWGRQRMPLVDGLGIVGDHEEAVGIEAVGTMQLTITRVHIRDVLHGIHLVKNNRNVIISDCHIYDNRGVGIYYDDVNLHQSNITGCHISYNDGGGIVSRAGAVRNVHITGCDLESNMSPRTEPTANVLIDCRDSRSGTAEVAITGCTIQHTRTGPNSANIRIIGRSEPSGGLERVRWGHVTITGNVLSDVAVNIHLIDCRGATLTGNTFWMGIDHDLLVEQSSNIVVGPNAFDRNPRYRFPNAAGMKGGVVFRNCEDCTLSALHINGVQQGPAGLSVADCRRMNITGCSILDCNNVGLFLENVTHSRVSDCLIRDDREDAESVSLKVAGGGDNMIINNALSSPPDISDHTGIVRDNVVNGR